ncbi:FecR domain-containing protein [Pseudomonas sp. ABC1]|uniref:FecR family protein n=1 Tax=Pseudomonas sp. ABC1 TaxID=2748080 RepID=UPI0015C394A3|nr:FecR domain-containing protein [Pseudomonas sp. ABC1]QLF94228.1 FecR domain-containing protein [Pseudomonas sp. ABC1]
MSESRDDAIQAEAREWLVLLNSGRATPAQRQALQAWCDADPLHAQAWARQQAFWALLGQLPQSQQASLLEPPVPRRRLRRFLLPALAACLVLAFLLPPSFWLRGWADHYVPVGERLTLTLEDGSVLRLNGGSAIDWRQDGALRTVRVYRGQVDFQVAADPGRPFVVEAGAARVRVTGTRFELSGEAQHWRLLVSEGRVIASDEQGNERETTASQRIDWLDGRMSVASGFDASEASAWQRGKMVFKSRRLDEVLDELARYRSGRVLLLGDDLQALRITGVFDANRPEAVLEAISHNLPVDMTRLPGLVLIRHAP